MARKKQEEEAAAGAPEWMATYSDLVTLLFCFFVLLYAMSKPDESKMQAVAASLGQSISIIDWAAGDSILDTVNNGIMEMPPMTKAGEENKDDKDEVKKDVAEAIKQMSDDFITYFKQESSMQNIEIEATEQSIKFNLGDMLFDSGSDGLKPTAVEVLSVIAEKMIEYEDYEIYIEGHTDNVPIKTVRFPDNWALSSGRAESVGRFFIDECGINPQRIKTSGRGEYCPIDTNDTPEGRQRNRRVEIRIVKKVNEEDVIGQ